MEKEKGGLPRTALQEEGGSWLNTLLATTLRTIENSLVFPVALQDFPSTVLLLFSYTPFPLLHLPLLRGSLPNLPFSIVVSFFLSFFSFSSPPPPPLSFSAPVRPRVRRKKLERNGRMELILRARKAKGGPPSLELHGALAITLAKRGPPRRSLCNRLLNIRTRVVGTAE